MKSTIKIAITLLLIAFASVVFVSRPTGTMVSAMRQSGSAIYAESCASCHGSDGKANTRRGKRKGAKDLSKSRLSRAMGIKIITYGKGEMPAFKDSLSKQQIQAVNEFVRSFR